MKVMIVEPEASGHRMVLYVRQIVRACARRDWQVRLLTTAHAVQHPSFHLVASESARLDVSLMEDVRASLRTNAYALVSNQAKYYRATSRAFNQLAPEEMPDVIYVNNLDYFDKVLAVAGSPFGRLPFSGLMLDVKYHRKAMGLGPGTRSDALYERLFKRVLRISTLRSVTVIDEAFAQYASAGSHPDYTKVRYVPDVGELSGVEPRERSREALGVPGDAFVILAYGSLTKRKGVRELLRAAAHETAAAETVILLAGAQDQETRQLLGASFVQDLISSRRLIVSDGFHDDAREFRVFNAANAVWLGYVDGFYGSSGVLYQAGSMGLPIISGRAGLIGWLNERYELGVVVDPLDPGGTVAAVNRLADNRAHAEVLGQNGKRLAQCHSAGRFQDAICAAIEPLSGYADVAPASGADCR